MRIEKWKMMNSRVVLKEKCWKKLMKLGPAFLKEVDCFLKDGMEDEMAWRGKHQSLAWGEDSL